MGLFDVFARKQSVEEEYDTAEDFDRTPSQHISIDVNEDYVTINGRQLTMPIKMDMLMELFGKPQVQTFGEVHIDVLDEEDNDFINKLAGKRINYVWNELGLYAFTNDATNVTGLMMMLRPAVNPETPAIYPKNMFGGRFTINGGEWFPVMKPVKTEYSNSSEKFLELGRHYIFGCFTDRDQKDKKRTEKSYSHIQISLRMN